MSNAEILEFSVHVNEPHPAPVKVRLHGRIPAGCRPYLFRLGQDGSPVAFDPESAGEKAFLVPCRFEADEQTPEQGDLVFVSEGENAERKYRLELRQCPDDAAGYMPLIGDCDTFRLRSGTTFRDGVAIPVHQGERLFGEPGLVVAGSHNEGSFFFSGKTDGSGTLRFSKALQDSTGAIIGGDPLFTDVNGDGILDILVCRENGTVWYYENTGSDAEPVFEPRGKRFELAPLLQGLTYPVRLPDGTVNPVYPEMSVICEHGKKTDVRGHLMPLEVCGEKGVLVAVRGGYMLYFAAESEGKFVFRGFALDEDGGRLNFKDASVPFACAGGTPDAPLYFGVTFHGRWIQLKFRKFADGIPVFAKEFHNEQITALTAVWPLICGDILLLGGQGCTIERYRLLRDETGICGVEPDGKLTRQDAYPGFQALGCSAYTDLQGDGHFGLLAGNVRGRITWYANKGTRRNPELTGDGLLTDEKGRELKINRGPDPLEPFDGYAKPIALKMHRDSAQCDILSGSGSGEIFHWRNTGSQANGKPMLEFAGVLQDTEGNPIRCHHMSALTAAHWFGGEAPDLIVAGQCRVHAAPDDDADPSQVRVYPGSYTPDGNLVFAPYQVIHQYDDIQFEYRPIPPEVTVSPANGTILRLGWMNFRRPDDNIPNLVECAGEWRFPPVEAGWLPAYAVRSELVPGDEIFIINSCLGSVKVAREAFRRLGGYASCEVRSCTGGRCRVTSPDRQEKAPQTAASSAPAANLPETPAITAGRLADGTLELKITTGDSAPQDMLINCKASRGPVYDDDRIEIRCNMPDRDTLLLMINPAGYIAIYSLPPEGLLNAPDNANELYSSIKAKTEIRTDGWQLELSLPADVAPVGCRLEIRRCLAHYAGKVRALEQRRTLVAEAEPFIG